MTCSVSESVRTVTFAKIESEEIDPRARCYPFPPLRLLPDNSEISVPILVLENDWIRAEIAPSLGGRVLTLQRKSPSIRPPDAGLPLKPGGRRGITSPFGIQLSLVGRERLDALGVVDTTTQVSEAQDSAQVLIGSTTWPMSFHLKYAISSESAELSVEARIFNRSLQPVHYNAGLLGPNPKRLSERHLISDHILISSRDLGAFPDAEIGWKTSRFAASRALSPRQLDSWEACLTPLEDGQDPSLIADGISVGFGEHGLSFSASRKMDRLKVVLLDSKNESLEATISIDPSTAINIPLPRECLPAKELVMLTEDRKEILRWPPTAPEDIPAPQQVIEPLPKAPTLEDSPESLRYAGFSAQYRSHCYLLLGLQAINGGDLDATDFELEQSLLFNGEDHLVWWLKAHCARTKDSETDNRQEILNAHYLAPLEPALRVEAFLSQPIQAGPEPNPILAPLSENPDALVDVASQLIEAGLLQDAARLLGESLRLIDLPMLRYLLAYCYLKGTRMAIEAAEQIKIAEGLPFAGPFPVRPVEHLVLHTLASKWPSYPQLNRYRDLSTTHRSTPSTE